MMPHREQIPSARARVALTSLRMPSVGRQSTFPNARVFLTVAVGVLGVLGVLLSPGVQAQASSGTDSASTTSTAAATSRGPQEASATDAGPNPPAPEAGFSMPPMVSLSPGDMMVRVGLGLALVLGILGAVLFLYRKATRGRPGARGDAAIEVVSQRSLGPRTSLSVVRVSGEVLLLGITQHQVNTLAHLGNLAQDARRDSGGLEGRPTSPGSYGGNGDRHDTGDDRPGESETSAAVEQLLAEAKDQGGAPTHFESLLAGEIQRVRRGLWSSIRRLELEE